MISLFGLLFALRLGPGPYPAGPEPSTISVRAESHAAATQSELSPAALLEAGRNWAAAPQSPEWPVLPSTPGVAPIFRAHRPEEWVSIVASQLNIRDKSLTRAAMQATAWVLTMPVRVDVSPRRVYVTVRIATF
jgi:hypothetical protein